METKFKVGDAVRYKPKFYYDAWIPDYRKLIIDEIAKEKDTLYYDFHVAYSSVSYLDDNSNSGYTTHEPEKFQLYSIPINYTLKELSKSRLVRQKSYDLKRIREYKGKLKFVKKTTFKKYCEFYNI